MNNPIINDETVIALEIYRKIKDTVKRGKDIQITHSKGDELKIFEIDKKQTNIFPIKN